MNSKFLLSLTLILSGGLLGCSSFSTKHDATTEDQPPITLGYVEFHFKSAEATNTTSPASPSEPECQLSLIWVEGKHTLHDSETWCGDGEKYTGKFIFRVKIANGTIVDTPLESLTPEGAFNWFYATEKSPWQIQMADYNNDGQPDFNLTAYGSCIDEECYLFTVNPSGKVEILKIEGSDGISVNKPENHGVQSTCLFNSQLTTIGFYNEFYNRRMPGGAELDFQSYDWDTKQKMFHEHHQIIKLRP